MGKPVSRFARLVVVALGGLLVMSACGGGDDDDDPTSTAEPKLTATAPVVESADPSPMTEQATPLAASPVAPAVSPIPNAAASPQAETLGATVVLTDFRVNLFQSTFTVGQPYTFVVENNGSLAHAFVIEVNGADNEPLEQSGQRAEIAEIPAGGRATLTWTFTEPGEYQLACHRDGHYARGMVQSNIVVTE